MYVHHRLYFIAWSQRCRNLPRDRVCIVFPIVSIRFTRVPNTAFVVIPPPPLPRIALSAPIIAAYIFIITIIIIIMRVQTSSDNV